MAEHSMQYTQITFQNYNAVDLSHVPISRFDISAMIEFDFSDLLLKQYLVHVPVQVCSLENSVDSVIYLLKFNFWRCELDI